ncbi:PDDEXK nuclease domain-containing protein [Pedobacter arcticus]|uniref:PDDEXK nuclease domain-containing protein n=1 Tax=Pedobacter arcticus TaxID=752140 RepID=UPI00031BDF55|nr:PDDEXK nuclease domain-containing protein [Pedobacter arcticus]
MKALKTDKLFNAVRGLIEESRRSIARQVNTAMVFTYYHIGKMIVEDEQDGAERATYAKQTLKLLSTSLTNEFGRGYSVDNLESMRLFYIEYGNSETVSRISELPFKLSWSHYVQLLKIKDKAERYFYEAESDQNNWSVRELKRQYNSSLYEGLALSKDHNEIIASSQKGRISESPIDTLKSPFVLEFLNLKEDYHYSESDLEKAIIDKLEQFMLELGKGFLFESRQKRITLDGDHFYIDLSFYNRLLKCFVLIDLKIGKLTHQDIGQMQMYVNYHDRKIKSPDENPTIGIILCKQESKTVVEFTLPENNEQIFAREYKLYLPSKEDLKRQLL